MSVKIKITKIPIIIVVISVFLLALGPIFSQFDHLKEPKISTRKNEKMLVVQAKGDPNIIGVKAFGLLFKLYYSMKDTPKGFIQAPPRARWPISLDTKKSEWIGFYALPVPETITQLPKFEKQEGLKASLTLWEYGTVAEILHIGPYDKEEPTIKRLKDFIRSQGYVITGDHEEEYIKGPTMMGKGDPEKYMTIIRYPVKKSL
jgi:hypothetical protein